MGSVKEIKRFGANRTIRKPYVGFPPKGSKLNQILNCIFTEDGLNFIITEDEQFYLIPED